MLFFIGIIIVIGLFLIITGSIKVTYTTKKEQADIDEFLSLLIEGDRITTTKFHDSSASSHDFTRIYTVQKNNSNTREIILKEGNYESAFIAKYDSSEFKKVVERNGDVVIKIIERKENERKEKNNDIET